MTERAALPAMLTPAASPDESYPTPSILDSRRLTGANWWSAQPGVVLEVRHADRQDRRALDAWPREMRLLYEALQWPDGAPHAQGHGAIGICFATAPRDGLMTATSVAEQAWVRAELAVRAQDGAADAVEWLVTSLPSLCDALRARASAEHARLGAAAALMDAADGQACSWQIDDDTVSVGSGPGGFDWPLASAPAPDDVPWERVTDVPVTLVTGSNGKTTTARLVAAMWRASGRVVGLSSSDGVYLHDADGARVLAQGDFTGPAGARLVLRQRVVEAAVLETARGGILRRGLATTRAHAAVITNISADHFGEYGVESLGDLARVKATVARALVPGALFVLNADDAQLRALGAAFEREHPHAVAWFSREADHPLVQRGVAEHGFGAVVHDDHILLADHGVWCDVGRLTGMPVTLNGRAAHNVENALAASLTACVAGVPYAAIFNALRSFGGGAHDNAGRLRHRVLGDVTVLVDYAHNPEGVRALGATAMALPAGRRLLLLGQAGNRDAAQLEALAHAAWTSAHYDRVIVKELPEMLRGTAPGHVTGILRAALLAAGADATAVGYAPTELDAVRDALQWAHPGDLLVLPTHVQKTAVYALLDALEADGWCAGQPLPTP